LLIAQVEIGGKLSTAELIDEEGRKSAIAGGIKNCGYWSAQPIPANNNSTKDITIIIGEGVATILSVNEAFSSANDVLNYASDAKVTIGDVLGDAKVTFGDDLKQLQPSSLLNCCVLSDAGDAIFRKPSFYFLAALSASNIPKVTKEIFNLYPTSKIIILADVGNGQKYAEQAAITTGATLAIPSFTPDEVNQFQNITSKDPTDFNDLHLIAGLNVVMTQISNAEKSAIVFKNNNIPEKNSEVVKIASLASLKCQESSNNEAYSDLLASPKRHSSVTLASPIVTQTSLDSRNDEKSAEKIIKTGVFVYLNDDGRPCRMIESKAAWILAGLMKVKNFAYNSDAICWHYFNGHCWQSLETAIEPERVILQALFTGTEPVGFKQSYFSGVLSIMLRAGLIPLPVEQTGKIPFKNGLLDIETNTLEPITKDNALTWAIPHNYHASLNCPTFTQWINLAVKEDKGLIQLLRAYINACLMGRADLQKFLHLLGPAGTGKSTFIRLLFAILGYNNCVTTDLKNLEETRFETATIYGKRLTAITDSDKYGGSVNVLKALTGQDPVRNEKKNVQMSGTYIYKGMVLIASNEPLSSTDYTSGLDRRRMVIKFEHRIKPEERAVFLAMGGEERLHVEIPAIINWALKLTTNEVTNLFMHPPTKAVEAAFESLTAQNPIADWISCNLIPDTESWIAIGIKEESRSMSGTVIFTDANTKLYPNYLKWCGENKREALSKSRFQHTASDMLITMGAKIENVKRNIGVGIAGIRIKNDFESEFNWQK
jgi:putative DNA primase/helicase